jgi:uroporphyrinogen-III decarboxylase
MVIVEAYSILPFMVRTGADIIDVDWMVPLDEARQKGGSRFIQMPGCEVPPGMPIKNLRALCAAVL